MKNLRTTAATAKYQAAMANDKLGVVFVLGRPGSGKGTVCRRIEEDFGYVHISGGELLRQERRKEESPYRDLIDKYYSEGSMVPPNIMFTLLETALAESESESNKHLK
jgi:UMP-CMP kinase